MDHVRCCSQAVCFLPLLLLSRAEQDWRENSTPLVICTAKSSLLLSRPAWAPCEPHLQRYGSFAGVSALSGFDLVQNEWKLQIHCRRKPRLANAGKQNILSNKRSCSSVILPPVGNWIIWNTNQNTGNWSFFDFVYSCLFPLHLIGLWKCQSLFKTN